MKCQDLSRILESRDVNALAAAELRACQAHAMSCSHCGPDWVVYTRLAAMSTPHMPQHLAALCEAIATVELRGTRPRPASRIVLLGTLLVVAAAAAILGVQLVSAPPKEDALPVSSSVQERVESIAPTATPARNSPAPDAADQPVTVLLVLDQTWAGDAIGRDYGERVYERARDELRALPGVVLVEAGAAGTAAPAYRITYTNLAKSGSGVLGQTIMVEMVFKVEVFQPDAGSKGAYHPVLRTASPPPGIPGIADLPPSAREEMIPSFRQRPPSLLYDVRQGARPSTKPAVPADCLDRRESRCPYTPADIAAFTILSWRLETTAPDPLLEERLHGMLRDSSTPFGLWLTALVSLHKYKMLRLDLPERLAAWERVGIEDPALGDELIGDALNASSKPDLLHQLQDLLVKELPGGNRLAGRRLRQRLVTLLSTELKNEPQAQNILESVAATDPDFDIRAQAKRILGRSDPPTSFMGPIEE